MKSDNSFISMVRGGQITIHYIRMAKQVIKAYLLISFVVFAIICTTMILNNTGYRERGYAFDYFVSYSTLDLVKKDFSLPVYFGDQGYKKVKMTTILSNSFIHGKYLSVRSVFIDAFWYSLFAFLGCAFLVFWYAKKRGEHHMKKELLRGGKVSTVKELKILITSYIKNNKKKIPIKEGLTKAGGISIPNTFEVTNFLVLGDQGGGKSQFIMENLSYFRKAGKPAIIYDPSGDFIKAFYRPDKDFILNPLDNRSSSWDLWTECEQEYELHSFTNSLIPEEANGRKDFFVMASRIVFMTLVKKASNMDQLSKLIREISLEDLALYLKGTDAGVIIEKEGARAAHSVRSVLLSHVNSLFYVTKMKGDNLSIKEWVKDSKDSFLFITCPPQQLRMLKPLLTVWLDVSMVAILSLNPDNQRRIATAFDEFASLNRIDSLPDFLAQARKYGNVSLLGFQNISQLNRRYGNDGAKEISGLCSNWVIFRSSEYTNAKWISDNLYSEDVLEKMESTSFGSNAIRDGVNINPNRNNRLLVSPTQIQSLEDLNAFLRLGRNFPVTSITQKYLGIDGGQVAFDYIHDPISSVKQKPFDEEHFDNWTRNNSEESNAENDKVKKSKSESGFSEGIDYTDVDL